MLGERGTCRLLYITSSEPEANVASDIKKENVKSTDECCDASTKDKSDESETE